MGFKEARERAGLTVLQAARFLEVSPVAVYKWEDGRTAPEARRLPKIKNCTAARWTSCWPIPRPTHKKAPPGRENWTGRMAYSFRKGAFLWRCSIRSM